MIRTFPCRRSLLLISDTPGSMIIRCLSSSHETVGSTESATNTSRPADTGAPAARRVTETEMVSPPRLGHPDVEARAIRFPDGDGVSLPVSQQSAAAHKAKPQVPNPRPTIVPASHTETFANLLPRRGRRGF